MPPEWTEVSAPDVADRDAIDLNLRPATAASGGASERFHHEPSRASVGSDGATEPTRPPACSRRAGGLSPVIRPPENGAICWLRFTKNPPSGDVLSCSRRAGGKRAFERPPRDRSKE